MGLETGNFISNLDASWPLGDDPTNEGNEHLQLVKGVLQKTFPGEGGQGFSEAITATETELNYSSGVTSPIQDQLQALADAIGGVEGVLTAPTGTIMLFFQAAAPAGWFINPYLNNRMIRVVTTYGGTGGADNPINYTHAHGTQGVALTTAQLPAHYHQLRGGNDGVVFGTGSGGSNTASSGSFDMGNTGTTGSGQAHSHGNTLSASWNPLYCDAITCVKEAPA